MTLLLSIIVQLCRMLAMARMCLLPRGRATACPLSNIEPFSQDDVFALLEDVPEISAHQGFAAVPAAILVYHDVVLASHQLVSVAILSEAVDVGSDCVGGADNIKSASSPAFGVVGVVSGNDAGAGVHPEPPRDQERAAERIPADTLSGLVAARAGLADAADAVVPM